MNRKYLIYQFLLLLLFTTGSLFSQDPITWSLNSSQGVPSNIVYRLTQDNSGNIWFATDNGVCYYDGTTIHKPKLPPVNDHFFVFMDIDVFGHVWFLNISGELLVFKDGVLSKYSNSILEDSEYLKGVVVLENYLCFHVQVNVNQTELRVYEISPKGELTLYSEGLDLGRAKLSLHTVNKELYASYYSILEGKNYLLKILDLKSLKNEKIKIANYNKSIIEIDGLYLGIDSRNHTLVLFDQEKIYDERSFDQRLNQLKKIGKDYYLVTNEGYYLIITGDNKIKVSQQFLPHLKINSLFKCREDLLWFATYNDGVHVVPDQKNLNFQALDELGRHSGISAFAKNGEEVYVGTTEGELLSIECCTIDNRANVNVKITELQVFNNDIYLSSSTGIYKFDSVNEEVYSVGAGSFKDFRFLSKDYIIASSSSDFSLMKYDKSTNRYISIHSFPNRSYACMFDKNGSVWVGNVKGLYIGEGFKDHVDGFEEKIINYSSSLLDYNISDIVQTNDSTVYVSTFVNGLYEFVNQKLQRKIWSPHEKINSMSTDGTNLLLATNKGALYYDVLEEDYSPISKNNLIPSNSIESVFLRPDTIFVGTDKGVNYISKSRLSNPQEILLTLNEITADGEPFKTKNNISFEETTKTVGFNYSGTSHKKFHEMEYKYQLVGLDTTWISSKSNELSFSNLSYGRYQLNCLATDGKRVSRVNSFDFTIQAYWYENRIFQFILFLMCITALYFFLRKRLAQRIQEEKAINGNQKLIDGMQMKALQNHMNPHFVSNALYTIHDLITNNNNWEASEYTSNFAGMIRQSMRYTSKERITLKEELDFLKLYMELESTRLGEKVQTEIKIDDYLREHKCGIMIPPLLIQPLVENSFKHGNLGKLDQPFVKISLQHKANSIIVIVEDNGIGFKDTNSASKDSTGLKTIEERLELNAKQLQQDVLQSRIEILQQDDICKIIIIIDF